MVTTAGSGYSRWRDLDVTRWREDATARLLGAVTSSCATRRAARSGRPATSRPAPTPTATRRSSPRTASRSAAATARSRRTSEVVVSPEDDAEVRRRDPLTNLGDAGARDRADVATPRSCWRRRAADAAHPGVRQAVRRDRVRARRRARCSPRAGRARAERSAGLGGARAWSSRARPSAASQYETDRARFLGRGRGVRTPMSVIDGAAALEHDRPGARSDLQPAAPRAARARRRQRPADVHDGRRADRARPLLDLADQYHDPATVERAVDARLDAGAGASCTTSGVEPDEAAPVPAARDRILYADPALRAPADVAAPQRARRSRRSGRYGISGDLPIVLVRIDEVGGSGARAPAAAARTSTGGMKRLAVDLVILNEQAGSLRAGAAGSARDAGPREPVGAPPRGRPAARRASSCEADTSRTDGPDAAPGGRARRAARAAAARWPSRSTRVANAAGTPRRRRRPPARRRRAGATSRRRSGPSSQFFNGLRRLRRRTAAST